MSYQHLAFRYAIDSPILNALIIYVRYLHQVFQLLITLIVKTVIEYRMMQFIEQLLSDTF